MLNVTNQFSKECIDRMPSCEVHTDFDDLPTEEGFKNALSRVQLKKAGGISRDVNFWGPGPSPGFVGFVQEG